MANSITEDASSMPTQKENILEKELNLTEYEKQVRRENGIISEESVSNVQSSSLGSREFVHGNNKDS